jgi:hypothetical protein
MTPMDELLIRLAEDRQIAQRERLQAHVTAAFESARRPLPPATPEVRRELRPLAERAASILKTCRATGMPHRRRSDVAVWDLGEEPRIDDINQLFDTALVALGHQPENPSTDLLRTCLSVEPERKSIWKRKLFL